MSPASTHYTLRPSISNGKDHPTKKRYVVNIITSYVDGKPNTQKWKVVTGRHIAKGDLNPKDILEVYELGNPYTLEETIR